MAVMRTQKRGLGLEMGSAMGSAMISGSESGSAMGSESTSRLAIEKYHGLGNDYLVYDPARNAMPLNAERVRLICDRHFGCGSDGILYGPIAGELLGGAGGGAKGEAAGGGSRNDGAYGGAPWNGGKIGVRIFNPDGTVAEKSGNGVRIFSRYLRDFGYVKEDAYTLATLGGDVEVRYLNASGGLMRVMMGEISFESARFPVVGPAREVVDEEMVFGGEKVRATCVFLGNPHCVIPLDEVTEERARTLGAAAEGATEMFPNRINVQLLRPVDEKNIRIEIYERGAGYTLASGSSSCAAAAAAYRLGLAGPNVTVHMPGGELRIEIEEPPGGAPWRAFMTGAVERVGAFAPAAEFVEKLLSLEGRI